MRSSLKLLCLLIVACMALSLAACSGSSGGTDASDGTKVMEVNGDYVLKFGDTVFDESDYLYLAEMMKDYYVYYQQQYYYQYYNQSIDEATALNMAIDSDGTTLAQYIADSVLEFAQQIVVIEKLCADAGIEITDESALEAISSDLADLEYAYGGEDLFDIALTRLGLTRNAINRYNSFQYLYKLYYDYRFGDNGVAPVSDSSIKEYFNNNFLKFDGAVFSYVDSENSGYVKFVYGEQQIKDYFYGNYVKVAHVLYKTSDSTGVALSDGEVAAAEEKANAALAAIKSGEKTHADFKAENEDNGYEYVFTYGEMVTEFENAAFEMTDGEVRVVKTKYGYHLMLKETLNDTDLYGTADESGNVTGDRSDEIIIALTKQDIKAKADELYAGLTDGSIEDFPESVENFENYSYSSASTLDKSNSSYDTIVKLIDDVAVGGYKMQEYSGSGIYIFRRLAPGESDLTDDIYSNIKESLSQDAFVEYVASFFDSIAVNREVIDRFDILTIPALEEEFYK